MNSVCDLPLGVRTKPRTQTMFNKYLSNKWMTMKVVVSILSPGTHLTQRLVRWGWHIHNSRIITQHEKTQDFKPKKKTTEKDYTQFLLETIVNNIFTSDNNALMLILISQFWLLAFWGVNQLMEDSLSLPLSLSLILSTAPFFL